MDNDTGKQADIPEDKGKEGKQTLNFY